MKPGIHCFKQYFNECPPIEHSVTLKSTFQRTAFISYLLYCFQLPLLLAYADTQCTGFLHHPSNFKTCLVGQVSSIQVKVSKLSSIQVNVTCVCLIQFEASRGEQGLALWGKKKVFSCIPATRWSLFLF